MPLYLEISGRCCRKTWRLVQAAKKSKRIPVIVTASGDAADHIRKLIDIVHIYTCGEFKKAQEQGLIPDPKEAQFFFDEFDHFLVDCPFSPTGYYVTTPKKLRDNLKDTKTDLLCLLLSKTGKKFVNRVNDEYGKSLLSREEESGLCKSDVRYRLEANGEFLRERKRKKATRK